MIVSLKAAREKGLRHYFTGKPCKRGHVSNRQTSDRACCECKVERKRATKEAYKERKDYLDARWRENNRDRCSLASLAWAKRNPGTKLAINAAYRARKYTTVSTDERQAIKYLYEDAKQIGYHVDHILPLAKGGTHTLSNLQIVTPAYNLRKSDQVWE